MIDYVTDSMMNM